MVGQEPKSEGMASRSGPQADIKQGKRAETAHYFMARAAALHPTKSTVHANGQVVDWIPIESQGRVASPPPLPRSPFHENLAAKDNSRPTLRPLSLLEQPGSEKGPGGTVPVLRQNLSLLSDQQTLQQRLSKPPPPSQGKYSPSAAPSAQPHWYANSGQIVRNLGGQGSFSCFNPFVQNAGDFSLLQTAVIKSNVPTPGNPSVPCIQTVEVGWIDYPAQVGQPHLFTFFNTNGYTQQGDYVGGWNRDVKGWVQYDSTIFPGTPFSPLNQDGGAQYELPIQVQLYNGNWWVFVVDRWIGYYPASLFSNNEADASQTLANGGDQINWYGEIYQTESSLTTTDMGSGEWPSTGWTHSAYIKNITYLDSNNNFQGYDGSAQTFVSDASRYNIDVHYNSGSNWGSYMWLGGPGAGGQVGAQIGMKPQQKKMAV
jgi:hypothetical protein